MKFTLRMLLPLIGIGIAFAAAPAEARNYDCSKAGNANKTACKTPAAAATPVAKAAAERHYDCSKAGNANKAACKSVASAAPAPAARPAPEPAARHYDCSKAGNANKTVCKGAAAPLPTPMARPSMPPAHATPTASRPIAANGPSGATAQCKDGTYSHSQTRSGTCSHHGGVATWY